MLNTLRSIKLCKDKIQDWNNYPFNIPILQSLDEMNITSKVCFFIGENGSGKSTLLEAIAHNFGLGKQGGSKNIQYKIIEENAPQQLSSVLRLSWSRKPLSGYFIRAESFFNIASYLDKIKKEPGGGATYEAYGGYSLHEQSHGESFLSLFKHRFSRPGFYLLDEPEAALSPQRQLSFLVILHKLQQYSNTQFIIATHSPIILAYPNSQIFCFKDGKIEQVAYQDTEIYQIYSNFLNSPQRFLDKLLADE